MERRAVKVEGRGPIALGQFLKLAAVVSSGGQAKLLVQSGRVRVNGAVELRRGRKLSRGDLVAVDRRIELSLE